MIYKRIISVLVLFLFYKGGLTAQENQNVVEEIPCTLVTIGCRIVQFGEFVITNETDYQNLMENRAPHNDCLSYELPYIDFNQFTLVGITKRVGGCSEPKEKHYVIKNYFLNTYTFYCQITKYRDCARGDIIMVWCLIPKINILTEQVNFEVTIDYGE